MNKIQTSLINFIRCADDGISARDLSRLMNLDKSEVNRQLYHMSESGIEIAVDKEYKWHLSGSKNFMRNWKCSEILSERISSQIEVYFNPEVNCKDIVCKYIDKSDEGIKIHVFLLWCKKVVAAIKASAERGVKVSLIVDEKSEKSAIKNLQDFKGNINLFSDRLDGTNHNKYVIIDNKCVLHGSINYNSGNENNRETLVVLHGEGTVKLFIDDWNKCKNHCIKVI